MRLYAASSAKLLLLGLTTVSFVGCSTTNAPQSGSSGNKMWAKALGGTDLDYGWSIAHAADGGAVMAGLTGSSDGDGGSDIDHGLSADENIDGSFYVSGCTKSNDRDVVSNHGGTDAWVLSLSK